MQRLVHFFVYLQDCRSVTFFLVQKMPQIVIGHVEFSTTELNEANK